MQDLKEDAILLHPNNGQVDFYLIDFGNMDVYADMQDKSRDIRKLMGLIKFGAKFTSDFNEQQDLWKEFNDTYMRIYKILAEDDDAEEPFQLDIVGERWNSYLFQLEQ